NRAPLGTAPADPAPLLPRDRGRRRELRARYHLHRGELAGPEHQTRPGIGTPRHPAGRHSVDVGDCPSALLYLTGLVSAHPPFYQTQQAWLIDQSASQSVRLSSYHFEHAGVIIVTSLAGMVLDFPITEVHRCLPRTEIRWLRNRAGAGPRPRPRALPLGLSC